MRMKRLSQSAAATAIAITLSFSAAAQTGPLRGLDDYVSQAMTTFQVPGVAVAIVKDGKVVLAKGYGVRKLDETAKVDEHTLFGIGSNTKAFTLREGGHVRVPSLRGQAAASTLG